MKKYSTSDSSGGCNSSRPRRDFLKSIGLGAIGLSGLSLQASAEPADPTAFEKLIPADKRLDPAWVSGLRTRGTRRLYRGDELKHIGLPIGGVCAGQLYLSGDGRLWLWDIFNENRKTSSSGDHYRHPMEVRSPLQQGFAVSVKTSDGVRRRRLDGSGFEDVTFYGEYPLGFVAFRDKAMPVEVSLDAFSPFIPLATDDSSLPATVLSYKVTNTSDAAVEVTLGGWLENAVCLRTGQSGPGRRVNRKIEHDGMILLYCSAEKQARPVREEVRDDVVVADFESASYGDWTTTGEAFGAGPVAIADIPAYQEDVQGQGKRVVNSHASAPGGNVGEKDAATGTLTSPEFEISRDYLNFRIGGGSHQGRTCVNLLVDSKAVLSATGSDNNRMSPRTWDVRRWVGKKGRLQIVDKERGAWGNIGVDEIVLSDRPGTAGAPLADRPDFGTMGLVLLDEPGDETARQAVVLPSLSADDPAAAVFAEDAADVPEIASRDFGGTLIGGLRRSAKLAPGESTTMTFALVWHFANAALEQFPGTVGRYYATKFTDAEEVAVYLAENLPRLRDATRLWHDTWYDSTLPYWFLDRTFVNTSILATTTCYRFQDGRFYGWEGVGCCAGTCLHVWQYAQAVARIFPELERITRERVDYGLSFQANTGVIGYRGPEVSMHAAADGQAGTILRAYREHQMCPDSGFLRRNWRKIKRSIQWLMELDTDDDGVLDQPQYNTLDDAWYGEIAWISSLYLAALRAGEAMAAEMGDEPFRRRTAALAARGSRTIASRLFNGEFFIHRGDPDHPQSPGSYGGCEIDQVFGQSYAFQVGLGRILDEEKVKAALGSLWRYNFTTDVGPYRAAFPKGRWYAVSGEGGLLMCTFPKGDANSLEKGNPHFAAYFNECMTGFEYQVAAHMLWERIVTEGLAIVRMIHDRYDPLRRNPFNEIECGDHYARAMASFGVYLAACGYRYHGPKSFLAFAPKVTPEDFRCAFTGAEGWGTYSQKIGGERQSVFLEVRWGMLRLKTLAIELGEDVQPADIRGRLVGKEGEKTARTEAPIALKVTVNGRELEIRFGETLVIQAGQSLEVVIGDSPQPNVKEEMK